MIPLFAAIVLLTPVSVALVVPVAKFVIGIADTGGKLATGVVDTGSEFAAGVINTGGAPSLADI